MKTVDLRACIDQSAIPASVQPVFSLFLHCPHARICICSGSTGKARI
jgi:hypothetical protein